MKKHQELESKIAELQQEADRLQKEVDRLKEEEEKQNKLPGGFDRYFCIKFLEEFDCCYLNGSFSWSQTPQGAKYWHKIYNKICCKSYFYKVPKEAIIYIQDLIIKSYQQEFESK